LARPQGTTAVLNAANEVAVAAFLERRIRFDQIHHAVNIATLDAVQPSNPDSLECLAGAGCQARSCCRAGRRPLAA
jgi:1-deoxy-D-xylulose-5-phosphate reductoisomerase